MKKIVFLVSFGVTFLLFSCDEKEDKDLVNEVNKNGSIETSVSVAHLDSLNDILTTKHTIWANGANAKTIEWKDTIPALGNTTAVDNENNTEKLVKVKKAYEIFITIK